MRLFLALPLPPETTRCLASYIEDNRRTNPLLRWSDPSQVHLTLRFLGEVDPGKPLEEMRIVAGDIAGDPSFRIATCGTFPGGSRLQSVYWLGGDFPAWVHAAAGRLAALPDDRGRTGLRGGFVPHLTVARRGASTRTARLPAPGPWEGRFDEIVLLDSTLTPSGPVYRRIGSAALPGI